MDPRGIHVAEIPFFAEVGEAIAGFINGLQWLPLELGALPPPRPDWPSGVWLEIGSFDSPAAPARRDFARIVIQPPWRGVWFDPTSKLLLDEKFLPKTTFEGAVHELGHLTIARVGALEIIHSAKDKIFGDSDPALSLSMYARSGLDDFWAEATVAANTPAWERCHKGRVEQFVGDVNLASDVPLI